MLFHAIRLLTALLGRFRAFSRLIADSGWNRAFCYITGLLMNPTAEKVLTLVPWFHLLYPNCAFGSVSSVSSANSELGSVVSDSPVNIKPEALAVKLLG